MKVLGIDIGVNTIGWAVVDDHHIIAAGCRVIPTTDTERTEHRKNRRCRQHHVLRRELLLTTLKAKGFLPSHFAQKIDEHGHFTDHSEPKLAWCNGQFLFNDAYEAMRADFNGQRVPYDWTVYYLRKKALSQPISLEALAWIVLQFNQKRGNHRNENENENENENGDTVGSHIYELLREHPERKVIGGTVRTIPRSCYREELNRILLTQQTFHPELDDAFVQHLNDLLYYQRPLRGKTLPPGVRPYEPGYESFEATRQMQRETDRTIQAVIKHEGPMDAIRTTDDHEAIETLKRAWRLNRTWKSLLKPRYERFRALTGLEPPEGAERYADYRYHTLNAIVAACADHQEKPWDDFNDDVRTALEQAVVSFKQRLKVTGRPLHKASVYGEVHLPWAKNEHRDKNPRYFAMRKPLDTTFDRKAIEHVTDTGIQKILTRHLEACGGDPKVAFSKEGIAAMNRHIETLNGGKPHKPIYAVRRYEKGDRFPVGQAGNKAKKFVEAARGTNLFFAVFKQVKHIKKTGTTLCRRLGYSIPLNVVADCQQQYGNRWRAHIESFLKQQALVDSSLELLFLLSPNDLVRMPSGEVYRVVSFTGNRLYALPMTVARCLVDKKEYTPLNKTEFTDEGLSIKEHCLPLRRVTSKK